MKTILHTLLIGLALGPMAALWGASSAHAGGCPAYNEPEIIISPLWAEPDINDRYDIQGISVLSSQSQFKATVAAEFPMGFTEGIQRLNTAFAITNQSLPNGQVCAQISKLEVSFGYPQLTIYLAKELLLTSGGKDSCAYHEMLGHEMKHVEADRHIVNTYSRQLEKLASDLARRIGVMNVANPAEADQKVHFIIDNYMTHLNASMTTVHNNAQRRIDQREEYQRLSNACDGIMGRLLGGRAP